MKKRGKSQSRSKSVFALLIVLLLLASALIFTFISFSYGDENINRYRGTWGAIEKGIDLNGGFYAVLEPLFETDVDSENITENVKESVKVIEKRLLEGGYNGATVVEQTANGDKSIRVEIAKNDSIKTTSDAESAIAAFVVQGVLEFTLEGEEEPLLTRSDIKDVSIIINSNGNGIIFNLNSEGRKKYAAKIGETIEITLDGQSIFSYKIEDADPSFGTSTADQARNFGMLFNNGVNPVKFKSFEAKELNAVLSDAILTTILAALIVSISLAVVFMLIFYKGLGLSAALSILVFITVFLFILSQLPIVLSLAGVIAVLLSVGIFAGANITIFERIKEEYASGRSLNTSVNNGFKRAGAAVIDFSVVILILAILLLIFGGAARNFAIILTIGVVLSIGLCYTVTRLFVKLLSPINNSPKFYGLKRGIIDDEE